MTLATKEKSWSVGMQFGSLIQRKKGVTPKLAHNWKGAYTVVKRISDVYRIQLGPRTKLRVVHHNRLWKYSGQSPPLWLKTTEEQSIAIPNEDETDHSTEGETSCSTTMTGVTAVQ